jgi:hypothetical protein
MGQETFIGGANEIRYLHIIYVQTVKKKKKKKKNHSKNVG